MTTSTIGEVLDALIPCTTEADRREAIIEAIGAVIGSLYSGSPIDLVQAAETRIRHRLVTLRLAHDRGVSRAFSAERGATSGKGGLIAREILRTWACQSAAVKGADPLGICLNLADRLADLMSEDDRPGTVMRRIHKAEIRLRPLDDNHVRVETHPQPSVH